MKYIIVVCWRTVRRKLRVYERWQLIRLGAAACLNGDVCLWDGQARQHKSVLLIIHLHFFFFGETRKKVRPNTRLRHTTWDRYDELQPDQTIFFGLSAFLGTYVPEQLSLFCKFFVKKK